MFVFPGPVLQKIWTTQCSAHGGLASQWSPTTMIHARRTQRLSLEDFPPYQCVQCVYISEMKRGDWIVTLSKTDPWLLSHFDSLHSYTLPTRNLTLPLDLLGNPTQYNILYTHLYLLAKSHVNEKKRVCAMI